MKGQEKFESLKKGLKTYMRDVNLEYDSNNLVIEQEFDPEILSGIFGLGYDERTKTLWMCLNQREDRYLTKNSNWNMNSNINDKSSFKGVDILSRRVIINREHPCYLFSDFLDSFDSSYLPGTYNNWMLDERSKLGEGHFGLYLKKRPFNKREEVKFAIKCVDATWEDNSWQKGFQRLEIKLNN